MNLRKSTIVKTKFGVIYDGQTIQTRTCFQRLSDNESPTECGTHRAETLTRLTWSTLPTSIIINSISYWDEWQDDDCEVIRETKPIDIRL